MLKDACPYCDSEVEIDHDDGYGNEEDGVFEQECSECGKTFAYTTQWARTHDLFKADCLNGAPHCFEKTCTYPPEFARLRCSVCGFEKPIERVEIA
jgi:hypothetical protein